MNNNKLVIAAAGSGKTTFLVNEALKQKKENVLITTFTNANDEEIQNRIYKINNCIPHNITIQTWFSFLLQHGVKPYQGLLYKDNIAGLLLVNGQSALKYTTKDGRNVYYGEDEDFEKHYFSKGKKIYSDKIAKFVFKCNKLSNGAVINRLSRIYPNIFIDEVQDLSGYDLELLKLLFKSNINMLLVGDPRQGTYSTSSSPKNKKFKKSEIVHFFDDSKLEITTDSTSLLTNYRSISPICDLSNKLYPSLTKATSGNSNKTNHDGVYLVKKDDINIYLGIYSPIVQLRDNKRTIVEKDYKTMNFGESKGLSFDRVQMVLQLLMGRNQKTVSRALL